MLTKILKNNTAAERLIFNTIVPVSGQVAIPYRLWVDLSESPDVRNDILSGNVILNNGTVDLNVTDAIVFLDSYEDAGTISFSSTELESKVVSEAIDEASNSSFSVSVVKSGTTVRVPSNKQMIVYEAIDFLGDGELIVSGDLILFDKVL